MINLAKNLAYPDRCAHDAAEPCWPCIAAVMVRRSAFERAASGTGTIFDPAWRSPEPPQDAPHIAPCSGSIVVVRWDDEHVEYGRLLMRNETSAYVHFEDARLWILAHRVRSPWPARTT